MTDGNNHLLQKVTFEIGLSSQDGAFEIQNRISSAFQSRILVELEKLFDKKINSNSVVTVDKLEINLGNLKSEQLEEDMLVAFEKEIEGFLTALENEIFQKTNSNSTSNITWSNNSGSSSHISVRWPVIDNAHFEANVSIVEDSISLLEKITFMLENGMYPISWTSGIKGKLATVIAVILSEQPEGLINFIRARKNNSKIIQRLVLNLTREQLQYLAALLGCPFSFELPSLITDLVSFLSSRSVTVSDFKGSRSLSMPQVEDHLWFRVLSYYVSREGNNVQSASHISDEKTVLLVRILLSEPILVNKIISARTTAVPSKGKRTNNSKLQTGKIRQAELGTAHSDNANDKLISHAVALIEQSVRDSDPNIANLDQTVLQAKNAYSIFETESGSEEATKTLFEETGIYIGNAGLIILAQYLRALFNNLGLLDGKSFKDKEASIKAIHLLQFASGLENREGFEGYNEHDFVFNKVLCGLAIDEPVPESMEISDSEKDQVNELLNAVLNHWTMMQRSSIHALQTTFFQKQGRLSKNGPDWELLVERDSAVEILIDKLPWSIAMVKLPWNDFTIHTQW
jgi:hypothetical protein